MWFNLLECMYYLLHYHYYYFYNSILDKQIYAITNDC